MSETTKLGILKSVSGIFSFSFFFCFAFVLFIKGSVVDKFFVCYNFCLFVLILNFQVVVRIDKKFAIVYEKNVGHITCVLDITCVFKIDI